MLIKDICVKEIVNCYTQTNSEKCDECNYGYKFVNEGRNCVSEPSIKLNENLIQKVRFFRSR